MPAARASNSTPLQLALCFPALDRQFFKGSPGHLGDLLKYVHEHMLASCLFFLHEGAMLS
jgi:hypothetical protein